MKSSVMYVVAWIYAIVGIISSFISGARFKELFRISGADVTIAGIIGTVFVAIILFAIAKILENTEYTAAKVAAMEREMKKVNAPEPPKGASNSKMSLFRYIKQVIRWRMALPQVRQDQSHKQPCM